MSSYIFLFLLLSNTLNLLTFASHLMRNGCVIKLQDDINSHCLSDSNDAGGILISNWIGQTGREHEMDLRQHSHLSVYLYLSFWSPKPSIEHHSSCGWTNLIDVLRVSCLFKLLLPLNGRVYVKQMPQTN